MVNYLFYIIVPFVSLTIFYRCVGFDNSDTDTCSGGWL